MPKVLLIEDDVSFAQSLTKILKKTGFVVDHAVNGLDGLEMALHVEYDVAVIDWQLPDISGPAICSRLVCVRVQLPLLMLTAKSAVVDRIEGLDSGALDYVIKTCEPEEIVARLHALLRRACRSEEQSSTLEFGPLYIDRKARTVTCNQTAMPLTKTEYAVLEFLILNRDRSFSAEALLERIWKNSDQVTKHVVRVYIGRLRDKLKPHGYADLIKSDDTGHYFMSMNNLVKSEVV
jgi:DNA-binding response OmpR family regulator